MKCGDKGHVTAVGAPCQQTIGANARACIWHSRTSAERRLLAMKGGIASRMRTALPATTPEPPFDSAESIRSWAQRMARVALTEDVDPRRMAEARGWAQLALASLNAQAQAELVAALDRVQYGGAVEVLLARILTLRGEARPMMRRRGVAVGDGVLPREDGA
jgi:hypothetical protein